MKITTEGIIEYFISCKHFTCFDLWSNNSAVNSPCLGVFSTVDPYSLSNFFFVNLQIFYFCRKSTWFICILIENHPFASFNFVYTMLCMNSHLSIIMILSPSFFLISIITVLHWCPSLIQGVNLCSGLYKDQVYNLLILLFAYYFFSFNVYIRLFHFSNFLLA